MGQLNNVTKNKETNATKLRFPIIKSTQDKQFRIEVAQTPELIDQALALRYQVFNLELGEGLLASRKTGLDKDEYDEFCDHLIVVDETEDLVVATYRILPLERAKANIGFYSETEFDLSNIYKNLPKSAEIGRCCVHSDYRSGLVMNLLWYGIATYMESNGVRYLFGCTSLNKGDSSELASLIYKVCEISKGIADESVAVTPLRSHRVKRFNKDFALPQMNGNPKRLLPSLMRGYLTIGVKICGEPAYDPIFKVIDFFTLFDDKGIAKAAKRFFR